MSAQYTWPEVILMALDAAPAEHTDAERLDWIEAFVRRHNRMPEFHPDNHDLRSAVDLAMHAAAQFPA